MPVYVPGKSVFREFLEEAHEPGDPRQFRPIRAGRYLVSIQASEYHASIPRACVPAEDVEAWDVAVFTDGGDGTPPRPVSPRSHPHLFRDGRWTDLWQFREPDDPDAPPYWNGNEVPTRLVADLLDCLVDPDGYAALVVRGLIPTPPRPPPSPPAENGG
jgi:hypothetical protein